MFSALKRIFEENVYSVRLKNMIQEMMLKASWYNKMISLNKTGSKIMYFKNHATKHIKTIDFIVFICFNFIQLKLNTRFIT